MKIAVVDYDMGNLHSVCKALEYAGAETLITHVTSELASAASINTNLVINEIYQDSDGILNIDKIYEENGISASYFISGPPVMIMIFKKRLLEKGVQVSNILTDDWE